MSLGLDLIFFYFTSKKIKRFKLSFQEDIFNIINDKMSFQIPENVFKHGKDKAVISIILYDFSNKYQSFKFNLYYGKNVAYIQLDELSRRVFEIIFQNMKEIKIIKEKNEFKELDNLGNKDRERLTLINYENTNLEINGKVFDLWYIISNNSLEKNIESNQISILDLENNKFIVKPIKERSEYDINFLKTNKDLLRDFESEFNGLLSESDNCKNIGEKIYEKYSIIKRSGSLDLNRDEDYLKEIFNNNNFLDIDLFWNYILCIFFLDNKDFIFKNTSSIQYFINKLKEMVENLKNLNNLALYEKIRVIYSSFCVLFMRGKNPINKFVEIELLNLHYIVTNEKKENSIMDRCYKFYESFTNLITEESAIFQYLLLIDGGSGYYKEENVYAFDLKNLNMIKSHLNQIFPKIILFCNIKNGDVALTDSNCGGIVINEFYITDIKNIDYNSSTLTQITEEEKNDIAMNLFLDLIHEVPGHKKYALSEEGNISPQKIFNKNKKLITLRHKRDYVPNDDENEYILTSDDNKYKGDSGHYLELCYGKYQDQLIIEILRKMKNKGKLIKYPELFTDDGKKLYEYVSLRKQIEENKIEFNFNSELSIYDDISQMKKKLENINLNKNIENKIENINYLNKGKRHRDEKKNEDNNDDKNKNKRKKFESNYLKLIDNEKIKGEKKQHENETEKNLSFEDVMYDRKKRIEYAEMEIDKRFKIEKGPRIKSSLLKLQRELDPNDPVYKYVSILLTSCYIKY